MQERVNLLKRTKPLPRGQLLIHKKSKKRKMQIDKKYKNTKRTKHAKRATN